MILEATGNRATAEGTKNYASRFQSSFQKDFFNRSREGLWISSIGIGTYKGEVSERGDEQWMESIRYGLENGINIIDTAIRYRNMRSEKLVGCILDRMIREKQVARDQVFISTKGGLIAIPEGADRKQYVEAEIIGRRQIPKEAISDYTHCMDDRFLGGEIRRSLENLGLACIDCYFLHNPELSLRIMDRHQFKKALVKAFTLLENEVREGRIACYGISSWNGFRRRPGSPWHFNIEEMISIARDVGGQTHHFKYLELPLSVGMPFIHNSRVKASGQSNVSFLTLARDLGLNILSSASVYEGHMTRLLNLARLMRIAGVEDSPSDSEKADVSLPLSENSIAQLFDLLLALRIHKTDLGKTLFELSGKKLSLYPSALNLIRSVPEILSALAGMEKLDYIKENLEIAHQPKMSAEHVRRLFTSLTTSL